MTIRKKYDENWVPRQFEQPEFRLAFDVERASLEFAEQLESAMEAKGLSRADLARLIGKSRASVTQALRRTSNLTLRRMVEFADACDYEVHIQLIERGADAGEVWVTPKHAAPIENEWRVSLARELDPAQPATAAGCLAGATWAILDFVADGSQPTADWTPTALHEYCMSQPRWGLSS